MRTGPTERMTIAQCQVGIKFPNGGGTGSFCKKRDLCRSEGLCHFVAQVELHLERVQRQDDLQRIAAGIQWTPGQDDWWEREAA